jgi:hypothetical protein
MFNLFLEKNILKISGLCGVENCHISFELFFVNFNLLIRSKNLQKFLVPVGYDQSIFVLVDFGNL